MKKTTTILGLVLVVAAIAESGQSLVRFSGGIGDITTGSANTSVRGVPAAGQIWVIRDLIADVNLDGSIRVDGRSLLLGAGDGVGSNCGASVFATLFCANRPPFSLSKPNLVAIATLSRIGASASPTSSSFV